MILSEKDAHWEAAVNWDALDFVVFGALLTGVGVLYALAARKSGDIAYRFAAGVAIAAAFLLVWVNGAVGIIGDESNTANLMFFGVLAIGATGALLARFQPHGMARALLATASAQILVAVIALFAGWGAASPIWPRDILTLTLFFAALWLPSAWLFRNAHRGTTSTR